MRITLNSEQAKGLGNFFFDIAKGLILGGIGSTIISPEIRITIVFLVTLFAFGCIQMVLKLLREIG